jgi:hypothetical protein
MGEAFGDFVSISSDKNEAMVIASRSLNAGPRSAGGRVMSVEHTPMPAYRFELPIGGCISELNCLQIRSPANEIAVRDAQQHLRDYGALLQKYDALVAALEHFTVRPSFHQDCDDYTRGYGDALAVVATQAAAALKTAKVKP